MKTITLLAVCVCLVVPACSMSSAHDPQPFVSYVDAAGQAAAKGQVAIQAARKRPAVKTPAPAREPNGQPDVF